MKVFTIKIERLLCFSLSIAIIFCAGKRIYEGRSKIAAAPISSRTVVIDAGHGDYDPGKTSISGMPEKDINLDIAYLLGEYLKLGGATVYYTRTEDQALAPSKTEDLSSRLDIAHNNMADIMISIHQNSYPSENVKGAQVFYYSKSDLGKSLAECVQKSLKDNIDPNNNRAAKANSDYYLLKNAKLPLIIVECGFLSNNFERNLLNDSDYREKVAWAIYLGILEYFSVDNSYVLYYNTNKIQKIAYKTYNL